MTKYKLMLRMILTIAVSLFFIDISGATATACSCTRSAAIAFPLGHRKLHRHVYPGPIIVGKSHRKVIITSPLIDGFIRIGPPRPEVVVVEKPRVRHIVVNLNLTKAKPRPQYVTEQTRITVWIRNSNGSRTSVTLTRSGPGYLGPRGEWYANMPTENQLKMVYGF